MHKLVAAYVHFYPIFQEEYRALGYPYGAFNDRVIDAIDDLIVAPEVAGPVRLVQPRVLYEFADPELEALSARQEEHRPDRPAQRTSRQGLAARRSTATDERRLGSTVQ